MRSRDSGIVGLVIAAIVTVVSFGIAMATAAHMPDSIEQKGESHGK
jgi:uncharacterized membrane protein YjgN (DUF898 family)